MWVLFAVLSAFFAGVTTVLAKRGIRRADSDVSTAIRTVVVLCMAFLMTVVSGSLGGIRSVSGKSMLFLILSGVSTGASWLCYFKALKQGDVGKVVPIDKSSAVLTMLLSFFLFAERATAAKICGMVLVSVGIFLMIEPAKKRPAALLSAASPAPIHSADGQSVAQNPSQNPPASLSETPLSATEHGESSFTDRAFSARAESAVFAGPKTPAEPLSAPETRTENPLSAAKKAPENRGWLWYAVLSAVFATLTSVLGKAGIDGVESSLGTFIRTAVVLVVSWALVLLKGKGGEVAKISGRDLVFILLSGVATGASWLCYFKALKEGVLSAVTAIDKCSVAFSVGLSALFFHEKVSARSLSGLFVLLSGTLCMLF